MDTQNKLNNIRSQLRILQEDIDQSCIYKSESEAEDPDTKLLDAVARRLLNLNSCNRELQAKLQRQDTDCKSMSYNFLISITITSKNSQNYRAAGPVRVGKHLEYKEL